MTPLERLAIRINEPDVTDDSPILAECYETAKDAYMRRRFGVYAEWPTEPEAQFLGLLIDMALDLYNKIGIEGQQTHSENGVSSSFESSWISGELLRQIPPLCGVVK